MYGCCAVKQVGFVLEQGSCKYHCCSSMLLVMEQSRSAELRGTMHCLELREHAFEAFDISLLVLITFKQSEEQQQQHQLTAAVVAIGCKAEEMLA
ncbi:hypothetical protein U1Q18_041110 [Sarracenia purpurea var. burkii]